MELIKIAGIVGVLSTAGGATIDYIASSSQVDVDRQAVEQQQRIDDFRMRVVNQHCPQYNSPPRPGEKAPIIGGSYLEDAYDVCFSGLKPEQKGLLIEEMAGLFRRQE